MSMLLCWVSINSKFCACGQPKPKGALQCIACAKAAIKRIAKYAVIFGAVLSLVCRALPVEYQAPCKIFAGVLKAC